MKRLRTRGEIYYLVWQYPAVITDLKKVLAAYDLPEPLAVEPIGSGLIHKTLKIDLDGQRYIVQQVNTRVFREPRKIAENLRLLEDWVRKYAPAYPFVSPLPTGSGETECVVNGIYHRLFRFVENSSTFDVVDDASLAYEAAFQFSRFSRVFSDFNVGHLNLTIPHFHDLQFRESQFRTALINGNPERIRQCQEIIRTANTHAVVTENFSRIVSDKLIQERVTHHDTKISNVLFDAKRKGITVIDLDTVMPGYFISDLGDMMRTYLSPTSEEEPDFSLIEVREDYFGAIVSGFLDNMSDVLSPPEKKFILYSGPFLIYMQAIRFLTDFLNDDMYYGARYEDHNLVRAGNQFVLLKRYLEKTDLLDAIIRKLASV